VERTKITDIPEYALNTGLIMRRDVIRFDQSYNGSREFIYYTH